MNLDAINTAQRSIVRANKGIMHTRAVLSNLAFDTPEHITNGLNAIIREHEYTRAAAREELAALDLDGKRDAFVNLVEFIKSGEMFVSKRVFRVKVAPLFTDATGFEALGYRVHVEHKNDGVWIVTTIANQ